MKLRWVAMWTVLLFAASAAAGDTPQGKELKEKKDRISYSIGVEIGNNLKHQPFEIDPDLLVQGIRDVFSGGKTLLTEEEQRQALTDLQKDLDAKEQERILQMKEKNKKEGEAFLAANAKKEGVVTLPSGLQYKVLKSGDGASPSLSDTVEANYRRLLLDGTEVDSSYKRGKPVVFPVNSVIDGWQEALQKMKVGDKWQLFVPAELAFGERGSRGIEPNQTLIFEVELVGIQK